MSILDGRHRAHRLVALVRLGGLGDRCLERCLACPIALFCDFAAVRSSPLVMGLDSPTLPVLWSTMTSENESPFAVYTESCSFPSSTSYLAEIGVPCALVAAIPRSSGTLASFMFAARSDFSSPRAGSERAATNAAMRRLRMCSPFHGGAHRCRPGESDVKRLL